MSNIDSSFHPFRKKPTTQTNQHPHQNYEHNPLKKQSSDPLGFADTSPKLSGLSSMKKNLSCMNSIFHCFKSSKRKGRSSRFGFCRSNRSTKLIRWIRHQNSVNSRFEYKLEQPILSLENRIAANDKKAKRLITFITDIEGDASYFDRYVEKSHVLDFEPVTPCIDDDKPGFDFFPYEKQVIFRQASQVDDNNNEMNGANESADDGTKNDHSLSPILVCGGDMWDKGGADLYVTRQLLSLQRRYGSERVQFILGNRDINKMRILQELGLPGDFHGGNKVTTSDVSSINSSSHTSPTSILSKHFDKVDFSDHSDEQHPLPFHNGVYWLHGTGKMGDPELINAGKDYVKSNKIDNMINHVGDEHSTSDDNFLTKKYAKAMVPNSAAERLRWMLKETMGSPDAFELRRGELKREKNFCSMYLKRIESTSSVESTSTTEDEDLTIDDHENIEISDEDVVASYKTSTHPVNGVMGHYIKQGKLAISLGGAMFMHGSLPFTQPMVEKYIEHGKSNSDSNQFWDEIFQDALPFARKEQGECDYTENSVLTTKKWVDALNSFSQREFHLWRQYISASEKSKSSNIHFDLDFNDKVEPMWASLGGYPNKSFDGSRAFGSLCQYGMGWLPFPGKEKNPTIVYDSWVIDGMPRRFYGREELDVAYTKMVCEFFKRSKLDVILTGHQPVGDIPLAIQLPQLYDGVKPKYIMAADTSYSGDTIWLDGERKNQGRGKCLGGRGDVAVTEILMEQCVHTGSITSLKCHGKLSDGCSYQSVNYLEDFSNDSDWDDSEIGKLMDKNTFILEGSLEDNSDDEVDWWVKSRLSDGKYLVVSCKGFSVINCIARKRAI